MSCKVCGKKLNNSQNVYCSNECKFSDDDYNKSRALSIKNTHNKKKNEKGYECKICGEKYSTNSSGCCQKHLKTIHEIKDFTNLDKYYKRINLKKEKEHKIKCPFCDKSYKNNLGGSFTEHLKKEHKIEKSEIFIKLPKKYIKFLKKNEVKIHYANSRQSVRCLECDKKFIRINSSHLKKEHNMTLKEYHKKWGKNSSVSIERLEIMKKSVWPIHNKSHEQINFYENLISNNKSEEVELANKRFDILLDDTYIEFDGIYWHGKMGESYDMNQIFNKINDEEKNQLIINNGLTLYRVWSDEEFKESTLDEIKEKAYYIIEDGIIKRDEREFFDTIVTSEYMKNIYEKYPEDIENNLRLIASFIQSFYNFPYAESNETLDDIVSKIQNNKMQKLTSNITVGNNFLKSRFHSFYSARKGKSESVYSGFYNIDTLSKIIGNRLGITYKESWDLTLPVIRKGFMSNYYGVSFFSPIVAYKIYNMIAKPSDTILDMSAGFGGRLLGWHAFQENGKYIGYEPNKETFNELLNFSNELNSNIELQNLPFEDAIEHKADVAFSCPPYFSTEIYSEAENQSCIRYNTFESWIWWLRDCIDKMKERADRVYLVVNERIKNNLDCEICDVIKNKSSHFTKKENYEYLIEL